MEMITIILLALTLGAVIVLLFRKSSGGSSGADTKITELEKSLSRIEQSLKEDFRINREESSRLAKENS